MRPFSVGLCPTVIFLRYLQRDSIVVKLVTCVSELCKDQTDLSLVSKTLCQVIVLGSMSKKANFLEGTSIRIRMQKKHST